MLLIEDLGSVPADLGPTAVTVGKFDGLHFGHRGLVAALHEEARAAGLRAVAITFDRHPCSVLRPGTAPEPIVPVRRRVELLAEEGVDAVAVLPFTPEFSALEPLEFVREVLRKRFDMRVVVVGADFRFGARGAGDVAALLEYAAPLGYRVRVVEDEQGPSGRRASSSWIRELLAAGEVAAAARLLGRPHEVAGEVVHGARRGREIGFPTANLSAEAEGLVPADGVYAGWLHDGGRRLPAAISIGDNPTFGDVHAKQVEAHVLGGTELDLYGRTVRLSFVERIRGMERFEGVPQLVARMREDVRRARELLGTEGLE